MNIIKKPLITEKYSALAEKENKYGFVVDRKATKDQIKKIVEKVFNVHVTDVNTMVYSGKPKTRYTKKNVINGRTTGFKKAVITLKEGEKIDFYSNI
jgi:large subunit ribosomal protein L23